MEQLGLGELLEQAVGKPAAGKGLGTPGQLLHDAVAAMRSHFGMDIAFVAEVRDGQRILRTVDTAPDVAGWHEGRTDPLDGTYCERLLDGRLPALLQDAQASPAARELPETGQYPVGAYLGVPVRLRSGAVFGTFCCFRAQPDPTLNQRDLRTLQLFADFVSRLLEQQLSDEREDDARERRVREVLRQRQFSMVFQPIFDVERHALVAYEALARFHAQPAQPPDRWFADAHAVGLQGELERAVIALALQSLEHIPEHVYLSLNVAPSTLLEPGFVQLFAGLPLGRLMLEITEHASISDYEAVTRVLAPLRVAGLKLAVDDAGAGFASFRHILQLRPNVIKLDASLIRHIDTRPDSRALAAALIRFAQETRCRIVAEGVETESELALLRELAVDRAQGYLLGRPGPLPARQAKAA